MLLRSSLFTTLSTLSALALAAAPTAAVAADDPPLLPDAAGVTVTQAGTKVTVQFTPDAAARAKVVGQLVSVACAAHPVAPLMFAEDEGDDDEAKDASAKVGADGVVRVTLAGGARRAFDTCTLNRSKRGSRFASVRVANVALTPAGVAWLDEVAVAPRLTRLLSRAVAGDGRSYRPAGELGAAVTALAGPDAPLAPGQLGYWTDGTHATVATLSAAGRRLVMQDLGNGWLRSNALEQGDPFSAMFGLLDGGGSDGKELFPGAGLTIEDVEDVKSPEDDPGRSPYKASEPVTWEDGTQGRTQGDRLTVRFTGRSAKAFRAIAGRRVSILCFGRPRRSALPTLDGLSVSGGVARAPRHGGRVRFALEGYPPGASPDMCSVTDDGTMVATVLGTRAGARWWQELEALSALMDADLGQLPLPDGLAYRATQAAIARFKAPKPTAMAGPDAAVARGEIGVWTDGGHRAAAATTSASGRRLAIVDEGDGFTRSNVWGEFSGFFVIVLSALGGAVDG